MGEAAGGGSEGGIPFDYAAAQAAQNLIALNLASTNLNFQAAQDALAFAQKSQVAAAAALADAGKALAKIMAEQLQGTISPDVSNYLAIHNQHTPITMINGFAVPATEAAMRAGIKAAVKQLELEFAAGNITQDQFNQAMASLNVAPT